MKVAMMKGRYEVSQMLMMSGGKLEMRKEEEVRKRKRMESTSGRWSCKSCGYSNKEGMSYCGKCGEKKEEEWKCMNCRYGNGRGVLYCGMCGSKNAETPRGKVSTKGELRRRENEEEEKKEKEEGGPWECLRCGKENKEKGKYCIGCGEKKPVKWDCKNKECGKKENPKEGKYCLACGMSKEGGSFEK